VSFSGVRVARSLVFCVIFCRSLFVLFLFVHWVVCPLIYGSWLQFCPLSCLSFDLRILITILSIELSVLWFTDPDYNFVIFKLFFQISSLETMLGQYEFQVHTSDYVLISSLETMLGQYEFQVHTSDYVLISSLETMLWISDKQERLSNNWFCLICL
jgi:hypothetical protein